MLARRFASCLLSTAVLTTVFMAAPLAHAAPSGTPNYAWQFYGWSYTCGTEGTFGSVSVGVLNNGADVAPPFAVNARLDDRYIIKFSYDQDVQVGESVTVGPSGFRSVDLSRGFHTLTIVIDPGNHVAETDETDNASGTTFVLWLQ